MGREVRKNIPGPFTVHSIYQAYPDGVMKSVQAKEQALVGKNDENLSFSTQCIEFNGRSSLQTWLDEVLAYGWETYGSNR
ncbi:hypothetical protein ABVN80_20820 [Acinetobacter baumannii]